MEGCVGRGRIKLRRVSEGAWWVGERLGGSHRMAGGGCGKELGGGQREVERNRKGA